MDLHTAFKRDRIQAFEQLYMQVFPAVARQIQRMGGDYADAKDTFHDAMILLYERVVQGNQPLPEKPEAYLKTIARNLWLKQLQRGPAFEPAFPEVPVYPDEEPEKQQLHRRLTDYLQSAGQKCLQILQAFYYHQWPMQEIAEQFGYRTVRSATVQKYKCLEKVREAVKQDSHAESLA